MELSCSQTMITHRFRCFDKITQLEWTELLAPLTTDLMVLLLGLSAANSPSVNTQRRPPT